MADTPAGETVTPEAPSNEVKPTATAQPVNAVDPAEFERLRKEADQAKMRANQLQNELEEQKKQKEEAEKQKLEANNEYKTLYEQTRAKLDAEEQAKLAAERKAEIEQAKTALLASYSDEAKKLAEEVGLELTDTSEESTQAFKQKMDKIQAQVPQKTVGPNNPLTNNQKPTLTGDDLKLALKDDEQFAAIVKEKLPSVNNWRNR